MFSMPQSLFLCLCAFTFCDASTSCPDDVLSVLQLGSTVTQRAPIGMVITPREEPVVMSATPPVGAPIIDLQGDAPAQLAQLQASQVAPVVAQQQISVKVPADAAAGDSIQARSPDGQLLQFTLPKGATAGDDVPLMYTPLAVQQAQLESAPVNMLETAPVRSPPHEHHLAPVQSMPVLANQAPQQRVIMNAGPTGVQQMGAQPMQMGGQPMQSFAGPAQATSMLSGGSTAGQQTMSLQAMHAMSDAAMQKDAVNRVMQQYQQYQSMGDEDEEGGQDMQQAYAKSESAKKAAEFEAMANMEAAKASEEVVNYRTWKRSNVLQDAALFKNELAGRMGEYNIAKANAVSIAGTDAAWKASMPGGTPAADMSLRTIPGVNPEIAMNSIGIAPVMSHPVSATSVLQMQAEESHGPSGKRGKPSRPQ